MNYTSSDITQSRIALTVAGMHRSGTSALAGTLNLLGVEAPRTLFSDKWNAKGHFESIPVISINNDILESAGLESEDWAPLPEAWPAADLRENLIKRLAATFRQEFSSNLIVVKDPRLCRFTELTAAGLAAAGWESRFILIFRDPYEVAQSLGRRNGLPLENNLLIWLRSVLDAEKGTRQFPRYFVSYDALLKDWRACTHHLEQTLFVKLPNSVDSVDSEVDAFLETELRHFRRDQNVSGTALGDWISIVLESYAILACDPNDSGAMAVLDDVAKDLTGMSRRFRDVIHKVSPASRPKEPDGTDVTAEFVAAALIPITEASNLLRQQVEVFRQLIETLAELPRQLLSEQTAQLRLHEEVLSEKMALVDKRMAARERVVAASIERVRVAETQAEKLEALRCKQDEQIAKLRTSLAEVKEQHRAIVLSVSQASDFARSTASKRFLLRLFFCNFDTRQNILRRAMESYRFETEFQNGVLSWLCRRRVIFGLLRHPARTAREQLSLKLLREQSGRASNRLF